MASLRACKALLELDAADALKPHGIGGHGRECLGWAVSEIERLNGAISQIDMLARSNRTIDSETALTAIRAATLTGRKLHDDARA